MKPEEIIILVIIAVVLSGLVALLIFLLVRNKKYKKYILDNSEAIKALSQLNKEYKFYNYRSPYNYNHRFDNKGWWSKTEPVAYLSREIRNDLVGWNGLREMIEFNRKRLAQYKKEIKTINNAIPQQKCLQDKMKYKKCLKVENKIFNDNIQHPKTDVVVNVTLRYVSPKGQVDISKSDSFNYVNVVRILDSVSVNRVDRETYKRLATAERAILSDSLRYDVLRRDGFRCVLCGMSSKDGAILHVDHIIPVSKGGKTEISNLRTLCEKCNIGKSNKIE